MTKLLGYLSAYTGLIIFKKYINYRLHTILFNLSIPHDVIIFDLLLNAGFHYHCLFSIV